MNEIISLYNCSFRGYGNREVAYCHFHTPWPDISLECDEDKCPLIMSIKTRRWKCPWCEEIFENFLKEDIDQHLEDCASEFAELDNEMGMG